MPGSGQDAEAAAKQREQASCLVAPLSTTVPAGRWFVWCKVISSSWQLVDWQIQLAAGPALAD